VGWGDELMAAGEAQAVSGGEKVAIVTRGGQARTHEAWIGNPVIAKPHERHQKEVINSSGARPYISGVEPDRWVWKPYKPKPCTIYATPEELTFANSLKEGFILIEPSLKSARAQDNVNRNWGWDRFQAVVDGFPADWVQFGDRNTKLLKGARLIETPSIRMAAAAMTRASAAVLPEGGLHHTAAALNLPSIVIFSGFIGPDVTGYENQVNLYGATGLGCGKRIKCLHCEKALASITPEMVIDKLREILQNKQNYGVNP
jgi:hypothetical protein